MKMQHFLTHNKIAIIILTVALCFIVYGIFREEINTVWHKASALCLECIGIG